MRVGMVLASHPSIETKGPRMNAIDLPVSCHRDVDDLFSTIEHAR
jgi:hypothetical protein